MKLVIIAVLAFFAIAALPVSAAKPVGGSISASPNPVAAGGDYVVSGCVDPGNDGRVYLQTVTDSVVWLRSIDLVADCFSVQAQAGSAGSVELRLWDTRHPNGNLVHEIASTSLVVS